MSTPCNVFVQLGPDLYGLLVCKWDGYPSNMVDELRNCSDPKALVTGMSECRHMWKGGIKDPLGDELRLNAEGCKSLLGSQCYDYRKKTDQPWEILDHETGKFIPLVTYDPHREDVW